MILALSLSGCDTMIADRMIIRTSPEYPGPQVTRPDLLKTMRAAMTACQLPDDQIRAHGDTLHWSDPDRPPGLHLMIHDTADGLRVTLAQDRYGPVGPTDAYRCMRTTLPRELVSRFGKDKVRLQS